MAQLKSVNFENRREIINTLRTTVSAIGDCQVKGIINKEKVIPFPPNCWEQIHQYDTEPL